MAAGVACSFFVSEGGRLLSCGDERYVAGVLGLGELDGEAVVTTPTLLPSMAGIRTSSVTAGYMFNSAVLAAGTVYTWGIGDEGRLGHGDTDDCFVPNQVEALEGLQVLSVATGVAHCLAVTANGEVFSWGWDEEGQCGHGSSHQIGPSVNHFGNHGKSLRKITGLSLRS